MDSSPRFFLITPLSTSTASGTRACFSPPRVSFPFRNDLVTQLVQQDEYPGSDRRKAAHHGQAIHSLHDPHICIGGHNNVGRDLQRKHQSWRRLGRCRDLEHGYTFLDGRRPDQSRALDLPIFIYCGQEGDKSRHRRRL